MTNVYLWYLAEFLLECELFQTKVVEKIEAHVQYFFFIKSCCLGDNMEKVWQSKIGYRRQYDMVQEQYDLNAG